MGGFYGVVIVREVPSNYEPRKVAIHLGKVYLMTPSSFPCFPLKLKD